MMDILVTLLLFVLKSFVAGGEVSVPPPGVELPASTAESGMVSSLVVAIDDDDILVGGERVARVSEVAAGDGLLIEPMAAKLEDLDRQQDELARLQGAAEPRVRTVTIQGDRDLEFRVLQRVMYTLGHSGFEDVALAVLKHT
jgi:biopolymer transport protein ExbD